MMIIVPFKPVVLVLDLLCGLIFAGLIASSPVEGKAPFTVDSDETRCAVRCGPHLYESRWSARPIFGRQDGRCF
jgi:hypothetical protein